MEIKEILGKIDHTALMQTTTEDDVRVLIDEAVECNAASVCIPACYVGYGKKYAANRVNICTVIGFPNGYNTTASKVFETLDALENGAREIDMVINNCFVKNGQFEKVLREIMDIKSACGDRAILKVIIEACLLTDKEKIKLAEIVTDAGAEYIKTSTGFAKGGATKDDVILLKNNIGKNVKIKAAGGIKTIEDAAEYIKIGCDRIGSSAIIKEIVANRKL